jgi:hypothetical protein
MLRRLAVATTVLLAAGSEPKSTSWLDVLSIKMSPPWHGTLASKKEIDELAMKLGWPKHQVGNLFRDMDRDDSGKVSQQEYKAYVKRMHGDLRWLAGTLATNLHTNNHKHHRAMKFRLFGKSAGSLAVDKTEIYKPTFCPDPAKPGDKLWITFAAYVASTSRLVLKNNQVFKFTLGSDDAVKGLNRGLEGACAHEVMNLTIPASLGYGAQGYPPFIPPNSELEFNVKVIAVLPAPPSTAPTAYPTPMPTEEWFQQTYSPAPAPVPFSRAPTPMPERLRGSRHTAVLSVRRADINPAYREGPVVDGQPWGMWLHCASLIAMLHKGGDTGMVTHDFKRSCGAKRCEPGHYIHILKDLKAVQCSACMPGKYQSRHGQASCLSCPIYDHTSSYGQSTCQVCKQLTN